jgi:hypothetical protein
MGDSGVFFGKSGRDDGPFLSHGKILGSFLFFPEPVKIHRGPLVKGKDDGRKDEPVDVEIQNKKKNKGCNST